MHMSVRADTRLHVGAKALRRESGEMGGGVCNSPRQGRAEAESPRKTEEDEEMLLEGEDKPVGETSQRGTQRPLCCAQTKQKADSRQICRNTHSERHHNREMNMQSHARPRTHTHTHSLAGVTHTHNTVHCTTAYGHFFPMTITNSTRSNNHFTENILVVCL